MAGGKVTLLLLIQLWRGAKKHFCDMGATHTIGKMIESMISEKR